jgi:hypothetical protein
LQLGECGALRLESFRRLVEGVQLDWFVLRIHAVTPAGGWFTMRPQETVVLFDYITASFQRWPSRSGTARRGGRRGARVRRRAARSRRLDRLPDTLRRHVDVQANGTGGGVDPEGVREADLGPRGHPALSVDLLVVHQDGHGVVVEPVFERDMKQRFS